MSKEIIDYKVIKKHSASALETQVLDLIKNHRWVPVGSHKVVVKLVEVIRAGTKHIHTVEYSQTLIQYKEPAI